MMYGSHRRKEGFTAKGAKSAKERQRIAKSEWRSLHAEGRINRRDFHKEDRRFRRRNYDRTGDLNLGDSPRRARRA
jgi:hypothetical protein